MKNLLVLMMAFFFILTGSFARAAIEGEEAVLLDLGGPGKLVRSQGNYMNAQDFVLMKDKEGIFLLNPDLALEGLMVHRTFVAPDLASFQKNVQKSDFPTLRFVGTETNFLPFFPFFVPVALSGEKIKGAGLPIALEGFLKKNPDHAFQVAIYFTLGKEPLWLVIGRPRHEEDPVLSLEKVKECLNVEGIDRLSLFLRQNPFAEGEAEKPKRKKGSPDDYSLPLSQDPTLSVELSFYLSQIKSIDPLRRVKFLTRPVEAGYFPALCEMVTKTVRKHVFIDEKVSSLAWNWLSQLFKQRYPLAVSYFAQMGLPEPVEEALD